MQNDSFLGRGWSYPPRFSIRTVAGESVGDVALVEDIEDIEQSLEILLSTSLGERVLQPNYGCNLNRFQFETMNASLIGTVKDIVDNAILYFEPRIKVQQIDITEADSQEAINGMLRISIDYIVRTVNSRFNYVYKFYLEEGIDSPA